MDPQAPKTFVLLVDDNPAFVNLVRMAFQALATERPLVALMDSGQVLPYLEDKEVLPSLILLDMNMPQKSGLELLRELRAEPKLARLPIVMMSTSTGSLKEEALGADGLFEKPDRFEDLVETLRVLLKE